MTKPKALLFTSCGRKLRPYRMMLCLIKSHTWGCSPRRRATHAQRQKSEMLTSHSPHMCRLRIIRVLLQLGEQTVEVRITLRASWAARVFQAVSCDPCKALWKAQGLLRQQGLNDQSPGSNHHVTKIQEESYPVISETPLIKVCICLRFKMC